MGDPPATTMTGPVLGHDCFITLGFEGQRNRAEPQ